MIFFATLLFRGNYLRVKHGMQFRSQDRSFSGKKEQLLILPKIGCNSKTNFEKY